MVGRDVREAVVGQAHFNHDELLTAVIEIEAGVGAY